jgi:hypothetical protein
MTIHPAQLQGFLTNLVISLYFQGEPMSNALPGSWVRDERARTHSGVVVFRPGELAEALVWCPANRPLGCHLPGVEELCGCQPQANANWHPIDDVEAKKGKHIYQCTRCSSRLVCKVTWEANFEEVEAHDTVYLRCTWPFPPPSMSVLFTPSIFLQNDTDTDFSN